MSHPGFRNRSLLALSVLLLAASPAASQDALPQREHVVKRGDTLWDLANTYLGNPFLWPMIYEANRNVVENPHWIYPGEKLVIPGQAPAQVLGEPVIQQPAAPVPEPVDTPVAELKTVDLRRPVIPLAEYYSTPWLESGPERRVVGRVTRIVDPSASHDKIPPTLHPHYQVYVGELAGPAREVGDSLMLVRLGREVSGWGRIVEPVALLRVDSLTRTVLQATVLVQYADAQVGDRVLPLEAMPEIPRGRAEPVSDGVQGSLLEFLEPQQIYGTGDQGFVSLGAQQLQLGDELAVFVPARRIDSERREVLPPVEVARARVVKLGERTATVRLIRVTDTSVRDGLPVRLVARTP